MDTLKLALSCFALTSTSMFVSHVVQANATFDIAIPACPAGYIMSGAGCRTPGFYETG